MLGKVLLIKYIDIPAVKHVYTGHPWDRLKEVPDKTEIWTVR
jgi:hypothetical protein